jgi:hypothetical protein
MEQNLNLMYIYSVVVLVIYSVMALRKIVLFIYENSFLSGERQREIGGRKKSFSEFYGPLWQ